MLAGRQFYSKRAAKRSMGYRSGLENLWHGISRLSQGQKLLAGLIFLIVVVTWLAVCALLVSLFV